MSALNSVSLATLCFLWACLVARSEPAEPIEQLENFDQVAPSNPKSVSHWGWTSEIKNRASAISQLDQVEVPGANGLALRVTVPEALPEGQDFYYLWPTRKDVLSPETTALRMRVRVAKGSFTLTCGAATAYFACSDVWAKPIHLEAGDWQTIEFSLLHDLQRNRRRAVFSAESPTIHLTRWIQEPLRLMIGKESSGELWIDDLQLMGTTIEPHTSSAENILSLSHGELKEAFTLTTEVKDDSVSRSDPASLLRKPGSISPNANGISVRMRGFEETSFVAVPIRVPSEATAFRLSLSVAHESNKKNLVVDFLALVAPDGKFPWSKLSETGFQLCLSPQKNLDVNWGFYHARCIVPNGRPENLVIPFSDFLCAYGNGCLKEQFLSQKPLDPTQIVALAFVPPFGQRMADTIFSIHSMDAIHMLPPPLPK